MEVQPKKFVQSSFFVIVNSYTVKSRKYEREFKLIGTARRWEANPHERGQDYRNGSLYDYSYRDGNLRKPDVNCGNQSWEAANVVLQAESFVSSLQTASTFGIIRYLTSLRTSHVRLSSHALPSKFYFHSTANWLQLVLQTSCVTKDLKSKVIKMFAIVKGYGRAGRISSFLWRIKSFHIFTLYDTKAN